MKDLKNLRGVKELNSKEQKNTSGGFPVTSTSDCRTNGCPSNEVCTEVWGDDTGGPYGSQSPQWTCVDPTNHQ